MKRKVIALLVICVMVLSGCGKTTPEEKSEETVQDIQQKEIADDFEELMEGTRELYEKVAENKLLDSLEFQKQVIGYLGQKGYAAVDMKDQVDMVHSEQVETYCEKAKRGESADVVIYSVIEQGGVVRYEPSLTVLAGKYLKPVKDTAHSGKTLPLNTRLSPRFETYLSFLQTVRLPDLRFAFQMQKSSNAEVHFSQS